METYRISYKLAYRTADLAEAAVTTSPETRLGMLNRLIQDLTSIRDALDKAIQEEEDDQQP